jgi:hypothetical protein
VGYSSLICQLSLLYLNLHQKICRLHFLLPPLRSYIQLRNLVLTTTVNTITRFFLSLPHFRSQLHLVEHQISDLCQRFQCDQELPSAFSPRSQQVEIETDPLVPRVDGVRVVFHGLGDGGVEDGAGSTVFEDSLALVY